MPIVLLPSPHSSRDRTLRSFHSSYASYEKEMRRGSKSPSRASQKRDLTLVNCLEILKCPKSTKAHEKGWERMRKDESAWERMRTHENGWERMRKDEKSWERMRTHEKGWERTRKDENAWERMGTHEILQSSEWLPSIWCAPIFVVMGLNGCAFDTLWIFFRSSWKIEMTWFALPCITGQGNKQTTKQTRNRKENKNQHRTFITTLSRSSQAAIAQSSSLKSSISEKSSMNEDAPASLKATER